MELKRIKKVWFVSKKCIAGIKWGKKKSKWQLINIGALVRRPLNESVLVSMTQSDNFTFQNITGYFN